MNSITALLPVVGVAIPLTVLLFTYLKDAHHVRLELTPVQFDGVVLGVNDDSACTFGVLSVGYFDSLGRVTWAPRVGSYTTNKFLDYPIRVEPRSLVALHLLAPRDVPSQPKRHGYCVQLETGRVYVLRNTAPVFTALRIYLASLASRLTRGRIDLGLLSRPRLPTRL